jgi:phage FluMu protein Com
MTVEKGEKKESWEELFWKPHKYNERIKLKSGTYLHSTCPHCKEELTKKQVLTLEVINPENEIGIIELSPYLDSFERKTNIKLPDNKEVIDLRCPLCHKSLVIKKVLLV